MINSEAELRSTLAALSILYVGLEALRAEFHTRPDQLRLFAEGPLDEIHRLEGELSAYTDAFGVAPQVGLWMSLAGGLARWAETPSRLLSSSLDNLRKGVQSITTFDLTGKAGQRPTQRILEASDPDVVLLQPGSLRVGLRWHPTGQMSLFEGVDSAARRAVHSLLGAVRDLDQNGPYALSTENPLRRRVVLRAVAEISPSKRSEFEVISFSGVDLPSQEPLILSRRTRESARAALKEAVGQGEIVMEGEVRELDLDKQTFKLREVEGVGEVNCRGESVDFERVVKSLGSRVRIFGARSGTGPRQQLLVFDMELLEGEEG